MAQADTLLHTHRRPATVRLPARAWRRWLPTGLLVQLLAAGTALRLAGLTHPSLWLDEAFSLHVAAHRFAQIAAFVAGSDAHPPLYYLLLHVWLIFGPSVQALRVLSHVDTRTPGAAVPPWLAQHYHLVHQQHFVGVTAQLYDISAA